MIKILFQAVFVGLYSISIFSLLLNIGVNPHYILFLTGFIKHLFGYLLGLQGAFCGCSIHYPFLSLIRDCTLEGILFLIFLQGSSIFTKFLFGFFLHIISEYLGIHKYFCKSYCIKN